MRILKILKRREARIFRDLYPENRKELRILVGEKSNLEKGKKLLKIYKTELEELHYKQWIEIVPIQYQNNRFPWLIYRVTESGLKTYKELVENE